MSSEAQALRERVADLEDKLDRLTRAQAEHEQGAVDHQGRAWTFEDFLAMGFTRRQALGAVAAIAGGASLATALSDAVRAQPTGDEGQVGTQANPVEVWASEIDAAEVATDDLVTFSQYSDVTSSRSLGTWETNNTESDIYVIIMLSVSSTDGSAAAYSLDINSSQTSNNIIRKQKTTPGSSDRYELQAVIPDGSEYRANDLSSSGTDLALQKWSEST